MAHFLCRAKAKLYVSRQQNLGSSRRWAAQKTSSFGFLRKKGLHVFVSQYMSVYIIIVFQFEQRIFGQ
jgi:hypothetical protein